MLVFVEGGGKGFAEGKLGYREKTLGTRGLPSKRLIGMCRCMGFYFHDWIDHNGVAFFTITKFW